MEQPKNQDQKATASTKTIDASGLILGRMASMVAKLLRAGHAVNVVNCEKAVVSGNRTVTQERAWDKRNYGDTLVGPYVSRRTDFYVKRVIRGMMPYKKPSGKKQFQMLKCYHGVPPMVTGTHETFEKASATRLTRAKTITIAEICKSLGGKL